MKKSKLNREGFTIIEVMIVLAIAGLIMLVVFLAVPALQRTSRNTQRKSDVSAILGGINEYISNNAGQLPANWAAFSANVKLGFYQSATDINYTKNAAQITSSAAYSNNSQVYVETYAKCNAAANDVDPTAGAASSRNVAVLYWIETSGTLGKQCQDI